MAFGMASPWHVVPCVFDASKHRSDIEIDFYRVGHFSVLIVGERGVGLTIRNGGHGGI